MNKKNVFAGIVSIFIINSYTTVYGDIVSWEEFPFVISLRNEKDHLCTGFLISKIHVIVAAHCFDIFKKNHGFHSPDLNNLRVVTNTGSLFEPGIQYKVEWILNHPNFDAKSMRHDIAILKLKKKVDSLKKNQIGVLERSSPVDPGMTVVVPGYGSFEKGSHASPSKLLRTLVYRVKSWDGCRRKILKYTDHYDLQPGQMCLKPVNRIICTGSCQGASGSPVIHKGKIVGILSLSGPRDVYGLRLTPDVAVNISEYLTFLDSYA